ncbi:MAG: GH25 family lysozyme [Trebonia sp.]
MRSVTILRVAAAGGVAAALTLAVVPGARASVAKPASAGQPIRGLDISAYQHRGDGIHWGALAGEGIRFVAIKVSEGTYYANPYYRSDARAAARSGLAVLPYVFANPARAGGTATARYAVTAEGSARGTLPLVVDLENNPYKKADDCYGLDVSAVIAWIASFVSEAKSLVGHLPTIYTTTAWWRECTGNTATFHRDTLWLAALNGTPPAVPSPWQHWTFWQYDNDGTLPGVGQTDLDYYQPTRALPALTPAKHKKKQHKPKQKKHATSGKKQAKGKKHA